MSKMSFDTLLKQGFKVINKVVGKQLDLNALRIEIWSFEGLVIIEYKYTKG